MSELYINFLNIINILLSLWFIYIFFKIILSISLFYWGIYTFIIIRLLYFFVGLCGFLLLDDEEEALIYARNIEYVRRNARLIIMFCGFYYHEPSKKEQSGIFWDEILDIKRFNVHYIIKDIIFSKKKITSMKLIVYIQDMLIEKTIFYKFFNKKNIFNLYYRKKKARYTNWYWFFKY